MIINVGPNTMSLSKLSYKNKKLKIKQIKRYENGSHKSIRYRTIHHVCLRIEEEKAQTFEKSTFPTQTFKDTFTKTVLSTSKKKVIIYNNNQQ